MDDHLSRLHVTVQFFARYPSAGRADPWRSYSRLLRKGLAKPPCCHDAGGLLHHRFSFSLTRHKAGSGSLLFCGANPSGCPAWPLASFLPYGARTFLTPATRAGRAIVWPASRGGIVPRVRDVSPFAGAPTSSVLKQSWARAKGPLGPSARAETARERCGGAGERRDGVEMLQVGERAICPDAAIDYASMQEVHTCSGPLPIRARL